MRGSLERSDAQNMTDGVQKGSGNAYALRTVANALSLYPTYEDFIRAFASGQIFTDLKINTPGWNTTGTALNKANLLSDAVETAIWGSTANRTPSQALEKLRALIKTAQSTANGRLRVESGSYVGTNTIGPDGPNRLSFSFSPKLMIIFSNYRIVSSSATVPIQDPFVGLFMAGASSAGRIYFNNGAFIPVCEIKYVTWSGNTVEWYCDANNRVGTEDQLNAPNTRYQYTAIG